MMKMDFMTKIKKWQLDDELKKLKEMKEVYERLQENHAMYLRCGDYDAPDRFSDKSITKDSMAAKIAEYDAKIKNQKIKIKKMEMDN